MSVKQITTETFQAEALDSSVPVLVDFYGDYCGPCRAMAPTLAELAVELQGRAKVLKVDVVAEEKLSERFQITAIPTFIVFKDGRTVERMVGMKSKQQLIEALNL